MRTLVIGDIHGNINALKEVLDLAHYDVKKDRLICLGDYIDYNEGSFEVVQLLIELQEKSPQENIYILGNHDWWFKKALNNDFYRLRDEPYIKIMHPSWYKYGCKETLESYLKHTDDDILFHREEFYNKLKWYHIENNRLFVHAGFHEVHGFQATLEKSKDDLIWNRSLFETAYYDWKNNYNLKFDSFDRIYIGHTQTPRFDILKPTIMANVLNLDQGCKTSGVLTCWIDETDEYFQTKKENPN